MGIIRPGKEIPIWKETEVLVVGGGPAGIGAAVSAARMGRKVLLLEKRGFLGGNITACYVENCNYFLKDTPFKAQGLYAEIEERCYQEFGNENLRRKNQKAFHSEYLKIFLDRLMQEAGVEVLFHSFVNEVILEGDHIEAVVIQTKMGPAAVKAQIIVDATGDGDVAAGAGVPFEQGRQKDGLCQPGTVNFRITGAHLKEGEKDRLTEISHIFTQESRAGKTGLSCKKEDIPFGRATNAGQISYVNYSCAYGINPVDPRDLSRGEAECREYILELFRYLKEEFEDFKEIELTSIAPEIGFRDSRRICGKYCLTLEDLETETLFEDTVVAAPRFYDMLSPDGTNGGDGRVEGKGYVGHIFEPVTDGRMFYVPYRCLVPVKTDNLLVAGRCISADHVAESGIRAVSICMMMGQAAGTAAAIAVAREECPERVDVGTLQEQLRKQGLVIPKKGNYAE